MDFSGLNLHALTAIIILYQHWKTKASKMHYQESFIFIAVIWMALLYEPVSETRLFRGFQDYVTRHWRNTNKNSDFDKSNKGSIIQTPYEFHSGEKRKLI